ncbi:PRC and DUF2382 domain-containing protein [Arthrobacter sp. MYb213]|uniref:DUF2382 domain-containing protein n=1 Tax=Arthrobacter sp. MYb213 TaxID=1848595 RepID=UPI000CFDFF78|nr:PRC and DUF2382 domain-containing protein [Arthrobacter sp. MYb213]PRB72652.1 photosystem reaction center subunit H [Arthrobacter sp. MYb213]
MINTDQIHELSQIGGTVIGTDGEKIGKVGQVFLDDHTGEPEWVTVRTGLFGMSESFVPLTDASVVGDTLSVPYDKQMVKDAPRIDAADELSQSDERELYGYYGRSYDTADQSTVGTVGTEQDLAANPAAPAERADFDAANDDSMTRSEEQLRVGTEEVQTGKVKLRKHVVTEDVTTTVPVSHEEVLLERVPLTDAQDSDAHRTGELGSEEQEVTLHAERPVVDKETVPVERVRLDTETVVEDERIDAQLRKEQIETEGLDDGTNRQA